jgi:transcriptional regulator with XRE-family HTH domain
LLIGSVEFAGTYTGGERGLLGRDHRPFLPPGVRRVACRYLLAEVPPRGSSPGHPAGGYPGKERVFVDVDDDARTIGARLRQIRSSRGKSLEVIAGLAGISRSSLSRIERGERALDSRSETVALANALQISPRDLTRLPVPAPANGDKNAAVKAIRRALIAVSRDDPGGQEVPLNALRTRVETLMATQRECDHEQVGRKLPELILDLHTSMAAGRDMGELLALAVLLHVQGTQAFLHSAGASPDLRWQAATLARQAAREHSGADVLGLAAFGAANGLLAAGEFDIAQAELDSVVVPTTTGITE